MVKAFFLFVCRFFFSFSFLKPKLTTWKSAKSELACWRSSFQLPVTLFLSMIAFAVLWFSYSPKNCVLMLTMRGKQWGMWGRGDLPNSPEACGGSHAAQTPFTPQLQNSSCFKVVLRRDWQQLQTSLSFALSEWSESHSMGNHEKAKKLPSATVATSSITLAWSETHSPPARGGLVYFEWCAIMTVQQISVTQVCGKWWNFRVILCKLLTLSKEVAMQSTSFTLPNLSHCCVKPVDSLLYFFLFVKQTSRLC